MKKDADKTNHNPAPKYFSQVTLSFSDGHPEEEAEVALDPRFNRAGELVGFAEVSSTQGWTGGRKLTALRAEVYEIAVARLKGREPTPEDADEDGIVRIASLIKDERVQDPFGRWFTITRWVTVEATF